MRRLLAVLMLVTLSGCASDRPAAGDAAPATTPATGATTGATNAGPDPVDVYAAAITRWLSGKENSFGDRTFPVVFVLDRLDPGAADPSKAGGGATTPLTPDQQRRIDTLVDAALTFVPSIDAVTTGASCRVVRDDGVFLALGPATATGADTAQVAVHGFVACMGATWFTYVLRRDATGWTVTGTTGAMAVS